MTDVTVTLPSDGTPEEYAELLNTLPNVTTEIRNGVCVATATFVGGHTTYGATPGDTVGWADGQFTAKTPDQVRRDENPYLRHLAAIKARPDYIPNGMQGTECPNCHHLIEDHETDEQDLGCLFCGCTDVTLTTKVIKDLRAIQGQIEREQEAAIWLLMSPGGEAPDILAAYTDPAVAAETEALLRQRGSYLWIEKVTNIQQASPRVVERLWMACYIQPDGAIWAGATRPAPYVETYDEYLVTPDQVSEYQPVAAEHSRHLLGWLRRPDDLLTGGRVYIKAEGTDFAAVRAAFDAEIQNVRALLAEGALQ